MSASSGNPPQGNQPGASVTVTPPGAPGNQPPASGGSKPPPSPPGDPVGSIAILLIALYLVLLSVFLLYGLAQFWPPPTKPGAVAAEAVQVVFLTATVSLSEELRLILVVACAGALGGLVHALRSFYWYAGNRQLYASWISMYVMLPFIGSILALLFYFVIRGGFFAPTANVQETSPFGFAALAGLVGLFTEQAVEKLKEVAETVMAKAPQAEGKDTVLPANEPKGENPPKS